MRIRASSPVGPLRFTIAWVLALTTVAAIAVGRSLIVQSASEVQDHAGDVVTVALRQRGATVELVHAASTLAGAGTPEVTAEALTSLDLALAAFERDHVALLATTAASGEVIPVAAQAITLARPDFERIVSAGATLTRLSAGPAFDGALELRGAAAQELASSARGYRDQLGQVIADAQAGAATATREAAALDRSLLAATLAILAVMGALALGPASRRVRRWVAATLPSGDSRRQLELLARYDHLTGLANRTLFRDRLEHALEQAARSGKHVALMFVDLDRFKEINDQFGHDVGDALLVQIAERLEGVGRKSDTIGRLGGDEFTILLEGLDSPQGAASVAQKVLEAFETPFDVTGREIPMAASIGIAVAPEDGTTADDLMRHADSAMYEAKNAGRGTYQFSTPELRAAHVARQRMVDELRLALDGDGLRLVYQPQVSVPTGEVVGAEALVRWVRADGTEVPAADFVGLLDETDLVVPLNAWVLRTACREATGWQEAGLPPVAVSVNVSDRQFRQPDLAAAVADALDESGLEPHLLELEVTEGALVDDLDGSVSALRSLKRLGVAIAIDDFGTGYSSLDYLRRFPIDRLKIDGSFLDDPDGSTVPAAIVGLAHHLGMETTAEGVERPEDLALLARIGCDRAQGYHLSPPLGAEELASALRRRRLRIVDGVSGAG